MRQHWTVLSQKKRGKDKDVSEAKGISSRSENLQSGSRRSGRDVSRHNRRRKQHWTIADSWASADVEAEGTDWTMVSADWVQHQENVRPHLLRRPWPFWNAIHDKYDFSGKEVVTVRHATTEEMFRSLSTDSTSSSQSSHRHKSGELSSRQLKSSGHSAAKGDGVDSLRSTSGGVRMMSEDGVTPSNSSGSVGSNSSVASASSTASASSVTSNVSSIGTPLAPSFASTLSISRIRTTSAMSTVSNASLAERHRTQSQQEALSDADSSSCQQDLVKFYSEPWLRGRQVKCKITDRPNDQLLFAGTIWRRLPSHNYAVKFEDGEVLVVPRRHIFPPRFASPVLNVEKWVGRLSESTLGLFMVDYPQAQLPSVSGHISARILDFLYIGDKESSEDESLLRDLNIKLVLRIHTAPLTVQQLRMYERLNIQVHTISIWDCAEVSIKEHWKEALPIIHNHRLEGHQVLIHCEAGRSRSGSMGLAYVMQYGGKKNSRAHLTLVEAMHCVRSCRDDVYPNPTFWKALIEFEQELLGTESIPNKAVEDLHAYNWHYFGVANGGSIRKTDILIE
eukprot:gb/GEZN01005234.1/.p1 GENE.gb/GEZN01005234.1/~~gb/GEZN01005234.1/.p1  ORF type:complete len:564 (+),score=45.10 gb/GEZN01005234.1/:24-1715(+)